MIPKTIQSTIEGALAYTRLMMAARPSDFIGNNRHKIDEALAWLDAQVATPVQGAGEALDEPLPCPFCGTVPTMRVYENHSNACYIWCEDDDCPISEKPSVYDSSLDKALKRWNTRACMLREQRGAGEPLYSDYALNGKADYYNYLRSNRLHTGSGWQGVQLDFVLQMRDTYEAELAKLRAQLAQRGAGQEG